MSTASSVSSGLGATVTVTANAPGTASITATSESAPAVTTRGFGEAEVRTLAGWICDILDNMQDTAVRARVRSQVQELCSRFPVYENRPA